MRLDPRSPLVINTHELGRRPGSMRTLGLTVPAPTDLGNELIRVPEASPVELDLRLEAVMEGVLVSGTARATISGECGRCLEPLEGDLDAMLQELYVYAESDARDDEASRLDGEFLDLEPVVRDAVVLALPYQPVCTPDCPGLCRECGARLADVPDHTHEESIDPRWAALSALTVNDADGASTVVGRDEE
ncbi:MAG: DUF177 domain-containing protein [Nocardioidaceae bacterium]|nr:DUF177 domain-containing protein [Nocardioidaceae bacterium]